jgi:hypothetical protein
VPRDQQTPESGVLPARTVLPRERGYKHLPLAAVHDDNAFVDTDTGEVHRHFYVMDEAGVEHYDVCEYVRTTDPTVFVVTDPSRFLGMLNDRFGALKAWRYTLTRSVREVKGCGVSTVKLHTFGFRDEGKRKHALHQCWSPQAISPTPFHKFIDTGEVTHATLLLWAMDVRAWAESNNLTLRNAFAGYAAQLLRDARFYAEPRRRVPRATNERARPSLPGNLIQLYVEPGPQSYDVTGIDQRSAHHRVVQSTALPDANTLFARGYFGNPENAPRYWSERDSVTYRRTVAQPGLLYVGMHSRHTGKNEFRLPVQDYNGFAKVFVYTNTVGFLEATGSRIEGIYAAWTSATDDTGLARYGEWAQAEIESAPAHRKRWLKPLLHSTYGLLAARPRPLEVGHSRGRADRRTHFLFGPRAFEVSLYKLPDWQPIIANLIQRGVIEAETQVRTLRMAQELTLLGCRVLHVHTDGIHVEGQIPLLPDDWAIVELTNVTYIDRVSWVARERECLPGRDERARREVVKHVSDLHGIVAELCETGRLSRSTQPPTFRTDVEESTAHQQQRDGNNADGRQQVVTADTEHHEGAGSGKGPIVPTTDATCISCGREWHTMEQAAACLATLRA